MAKPARSENVRQDGFERRAERLHLLGKGKYPQPAVWQPFRGKARQGPFGQPHSEIVVAFNKGRQCPDRGRGRPIPLPGADLPHGPPPWRVLFHQRQRNTDRAFPLPGIEIGEEIHKPGDPIAFGDQHINRQRSTEMDHHLLQALAQPVGHLGCQCLFEQQIGWQGENDAIQRPARPGRLEAVQEVLPLTSFLWTGLGHKRARRIDKNGLISDPPGAILAEIRPGAQGRGRTESGFQGKLQSGIGQRSRPARAACPQQHIPGELFQIAPASTPRAQPLTQGFTQQGEALTHLAGAVRQAGNRALRSADIVQNTPIDPLQPPAPQPLKQQEDGGKRADRNQTTGLAGQRHSLVYGQLWPTKPDQEGESNQQRQTQGESG